MSEKTYKVVMSERCYRFKPDAIPGHAPRAPGVYEFVTFDAQRRPVVLFVGLAGSSIVESLEDHWLGKGKPTREELFAAAPDVYFDFVASSDAAGPDDLKDIAGALQSRHKPKLNTAPAPGSGRYSAVKVEEVG